MHDLEKQAGTRWRETITAHGRTLDFDVAAEVPPVEAMGVYRVRQVRGEQFRSQPQPELPPKRRGIARRRRAEEVFAPGALPEGFVIEDALLNATVGGQLISSLLAVCCVTVAFCSNLLMVQDRVSGARRDLAVSPVRPSTIAVA